VYQLVDKWNFDNVGMLHGTDVEISISIFISVINQLDAQNFCFTIRLFHASTCFEHMCSSSGGQNCIIQPLVSSHLSVAVSCTRRGSNPWCLWWWCWWIIQRLRYFPVHKILNALFIIIIILNCLLLTVRWGSSDKPRFQQEIKVIYPSTIQLLCAVLISVTFCSSMADGWPWSNWRFWYNPLWTVPNAPIITDTICVLTVHILLTAISRSLYLPSLSVCLCKSLNHLFWIYWSVGKSSTASVV